MKFNTHKSSIFLFLTLFFFLGGEVWAQCAHQRSRTCGVRSVCNQCRSARAPIGHRPTFNARLGVPVRWVTPTVRYNAPAYGYGRGTYRNYGYGYGYGQNYNYRPYRARRVRGRGYCR